MTTRAHNYILALIGFSIVTMVFGQVRFVQAAPPCLDTTTQNDGTSCPSLTQVCEGLSGCSVYTVVLEQPTATANSAKVDITSNAFFTPVFPAWGCLGTTAVCTAVPTSNTTFWKSFGSTLYGNNQKILGATLSGLRAGQTYTATYQGVWTGHVSNVNQTFTTWPGVSTVPAISNLTATSATISWTTPFVSDIEVNYSTTPPSWLLEGTAATSAALQTTAATSDGSAWAAGFGGLIEKRDTTGWIIQTSPTSNFLQGMSAYDADNVWISGANGTVLRTTNGGGTWSAVNPGPGVSMNGIYAPLANTAWVVGDAGNGFFFDGSVWNVRHPATAVNLHTVYSLNNHEVWVGGDGGTIWHSTDGGVTWTTQPSGVGTPINTITSLDGKELFAGTTAGIILHSVNSGVSWQQIPTGSVYSVKVIDLLTNTKYWFSTDYQVAYSEAGVITFYGDPSAQFGSQVAGLAVINGSNILAVGQQNRISSFTMCHFGTFQCGASRIDPTLTLTHSISLTGLPSGQPIFFAAESYGSAVVGEGQFGTLITTFPDTVPPTISFVNPPPPGPTYTNVTPYPVSGVAADTAPGTVQTVTLKNNGVNQTVAGTTSWTSSVVPVAGLNTLVATAIDGGANVATDTSSIFFDAIKPTLTITAPTKFSIVNVSPVNVTGTVSDNDQVASMNISINNGIPTNITPVAGWSTTAGLVPGANTIVVTATDRAGNVETAQVTFNYAAPTFTLTAAPASQTGFVGDVKTYTITATSQSSFVGSVNLSAVSAPAGLVASFSPVSINLTSGLTATSTLTISTASVGGGTYTITTTGVSGAITKTANVQLILNAAPDFTISATPSPLNVVAGQASSYQVSVSANNTFAGPVAFSVTGLPSGVTLTFNPANVSLATSQTNNSIVGNVTTLTTVANGDYPLSITGNGTNTANGATVSHIAAVILHISPAPDLGLTFLPASQTVNAGGTPTSYNGTISSLNGFGGAGTAVNLTVTSNYAGPGLTMNLQPPQVILATGDVKNSSLNVTADNSVPGGTYTLTIRAIGGSVTKQTTVNLVVVEDNVPPVISAINITPNYNNVRVTWTTDELANSSISVYTDATRTTLVDTVSALSIFCTSACHNMFDQPGPTGFSPLTTYYVTVSSTDTSPSALTTTVTTDAGGQPLQFTTLDTPDTTNPIVTMTSPADSATPPSVVGTITVAGGATDDKKVGFVQLTIINQTTGVTEIDAQLTCAGPSCSYTYNWDTTQLGAPGNGPHAVTVVAHDAAGNLSAPITHYVSVDNDYTNPVIMMGPDATNLQCTAIDCQITISWTTDDPSTSEVGYDTPAPAFCDAVTNVCTYTNHTQYDDTAPSDASPVYNLHRVTLRGLQKNVIYHYRVFSCNRSNLCLQGG